MSHICFYNVNCACACRCVYMCVCVWPWKSPIWKQLLAVRALRHPQCLSLWPKRNVSPSPFFFLSLLPCLFLLPLSFCTSFSFLFSLTGLNYFHMSPNKRARWNPFLFLLFIYLFLLGTIPPHRSPCNHILIQITHYQFVQTSPENTSTN